MSRKSPTNSNPVKRFNFSSNTISDIISSRSKSRSPLKSNTNYNHNRSEESTHKKSLTQTKTQSQTQTHRNHNMNYDFGNLCFNVNDDWKTLVVKNTNLRKLVVQSSEKVEQLQNHILSLESSHEKEKKSIFEELERISEKYQVYAESHRILQQQGESIAQSKNEKLHTSELLNKYQDHISIFLIDYILLFHKVFHYLSQNKAPVMEFVASIKDFILDNFVKYQDIVSHYHFPEIYDEYSKIVQNQGHYRNLSKSKASMTGKSIGSKVGVGNTGDRSTQSKHVKFPITGPGQDRSRTRISPSPEKTQSSYNSSTNINKNKRNSNSNSKGRGMKSNMDSISNIGKENVVISKDVSSFNSMKVNVNTEHNSYNYHPSHSHNNHKNTMNYEDKEQDQKRNITMHSQSQSQKVQAAEENIYPELLASKDTDKESVLVVATEDFKAQESKYISCQKGEVFTIQYIDQDKQEILATNDKKTGLIPINYLQIYE